MEKISIIVPVYKVEKYLDRCVESIVNQTYKNLEIILVDDGSPDNCPQMCDEWAKKDSRIKVIHKQNGGLSTARNAGLDISTGKYIQFVDSDDFLELNACEVLLKNIVETNADLVVGNVNFITKRKKNVKLNSFVTTNKVEFMKIMLNKKIFNVAWNKLYKKSLIKEQFSLDVRKYGEDFLFNCDYLFNCNILSFCSEIVYNYFVSLPGAITHTYSKLCFINHCKLCDYIDDKLISYYKNDIKYFKCLKYYFIFSAILNIVKADKLKYKEKRKKVKEIKNTSYFKSIKFNQLSFSYKVLYILTKMNFIFTTECLLKIFN